MLGYIPGRGVLAGRPVTWHGGRKRVSPPAGPPSARRHPGPVSRGAGRRTSVPCPPYGGAVAARVSDAPFGTPFALYLIRKRHNGVPGQETGVPRRPAGADVLAAAGR